MKNRKTFYQYLKAHAGVHSEHDILIQAHEGQITFTIAPRIGDAALKARETFHFSVAEGGYVKAQDKE